jgi:hypothetical protein
MTMYDLFTFDLEEADFEERVVFRSKELILDVITLQ